MVNSDAVLLQSDHVKIFWTSSSTKLGAYYSLDIVIARCDLSTTNARMVKST